MHRRNMNVLGLALAVAATGPATAMTDDGRVMVGHDPGFPEPRTPPRIPGAPVSARQLERMRAKNARRKKRKNRRGW